MADIAIRMHAGWRFTTRFLKKFFEDESQYIKWAKRSSNEDEFNKINNEILKIFEKSEWIYTGSLSKTYKEIRKYYVNIDNMMIFVTDMNDEAIITCCDIYFDLDDDLDKDTAKLIMKKIKKLYTEKNKNNKNITKQLIEVDISIENTNEEIQQLELLLNTFKKKLENLNEQKDLIKKENQIINYQIEKLARKLCFSIEFRTDLSNVC